MLTGDAVLRAAVWLQYGQPPSPGSPGAQSEGVKIRQKKGKI